MTIKTVTVGNSGNADDTHGDGYGGVDYEYRIGKYEVTNAQYTEFLAGGPSLPKAQAARWRTDECFDPDSALARAGTAGAASSPSRPRSVAAQ